MVWQANLWNMLHDVAWICPVEVRKGQDAGEPGVTFPETQQPPELENAVVSEASVWGSEASARVASEPESTLHEARAPWKVAQFVAIYRPAWNAVWK